MIYLLDSSILYWWATGTLAAPAIRTLIERPEQQLIGSVATIYELEWKHRIGKLPVYPISIRQFAHHVGLMWMPISDSDAEAAAQLDWPHRDPWDRLIAAQALRLEATLLSADSGFDAVGVKRLWG
jgi:PIN domain nuclease of toxin-antitoxin system